MTPLPPARPQRRHVRSAPRRISTAAGITPAHLAEAGKDLGRYLAHWRTAAGLRQVDLAALIRNFRSQIANVENGRDNTTLHANGALLAVYDQAHALMRDFQTQTELASDQKRQLSTTQPAPLTSVPAASPTLCKGCGPTVVGRWTRREIHALREALRMSIRAFAEHLGVAPGAVTAWEHRNHPRNPEPRGTVDVGPGPHPRRHRLQGPLPTSFP
ncbi:helix-turn-helix domain-containing protein [Micromonospora sp. CA-263727]|uniref:helix-turn-helix domain-containing protein n=1 Tax=Micromonospora sp. CA-263727 TaxID=3239967 RepID=UPI003D8E7285